MKVLFTTPILEHPAAGGPQLRIENSIKALSRVSELYVVSRISRHYIGGVEAERFYRKYSKEFMYAPSAVEFHNNRYIRLMQRAYRKLFGNKGDAQFIVDFIRKNDIDAIWFGYGNISFPLIKEIKQIMPDLKLVCDTDSVWSRFVLRELPYESDPTRKAEIEKAGREKEQEEKEWVNLCEVTTAVSEIDADYYRGLAIDPSRIRIFSNVIDLNSYKATQVPPAEFKKPCMYLAGSFGPKSAMDKAARWVIEHVLPIVRKSIPNIHFYIVGRGSKETLGDVKDPDITITGKLPSVLPYLFNADVALVPLKFESGTRFKIMEAGTCGIPIVSTTLGAEGIPVTDGQDIIIADTPEEFASGIIKIIQNKELGEKLAQECMNLIQERYSVESLAQEAKEILGYLEVL
ncbi:MAG TPA: glycosyltransferase family 4 protein [Candidatus Aquicultor sp.]|jgi:glycosyltransferase involved in cell wall biosynthesis